MAMFTVVALFDFVIGGSIDAIDAPASIIIACFFSIACGLSATYLEVTLGLFILLGIWVAKLVILANSPGDVVRACLVYGLPVLMNAVTVWGTIFPNDELRRLR
jgi:hypothetical protein